MPDYIVRLGAKGCLRLNRKAYFDEAQRSTFRFNASGVTVAIFDRFTAVADTGVPDGLLIQVARSAQDIEEAMHTAEAIATVMLSMLSFAGAGSIHQPFVLFAYDATAGLQERQYVLVHHDFITPTAKRRLEEDVMQELFTRYDQYFSANTVPDDHKKRIVYAITAYRRALADNNDVLTEILLLWSSMEGLDCVYRKAFPSRQAQFMDGVRDVFGRIGQSQAFDVLEPLRNEVAHGNIDLTTADQRATTNLEHARKALMLMVMRILKCDEPIGNRVIGLPVYKGNVVTNIRLDVMVTCKPGPVGDVVGHPEILAKYHGAKVVKTGESIQIEPDWRFSVKNIETWTPGSAQVRGDPGANVRVNGLGITVTSSDEEPDSES